MHRLRVVSFDEVQNEKENNTEKSKNKLKRHHDRKICQNIVSTLKEMKTQRLKAHNATNTEGQLIKNDTGVRAVNKISLTSISEQVRLRTKGVFLKSLTSIKTISLDDIRQALIYNVYGKRRQKKAKQSHKSTAVSNINVHRSIESKDDIQVLYSFERAKSPGNKRNYYIRRSSSDIFGIGSAKRARKNAYLCFHTSNYTGLFPTQKRRKKKTESKPYIIPQVDPVTVPSRSKSLRFRRESSIHYNVVGFPNCSKISVDSGKVKDEGSTLRSHDHHYHHHDTPRHCYLLENHQPTATLVTSLDSKGDADNSCVCKTEAKERKPSDICIIKNRVCSDERLQKKDKCRICLKNLKSVLLCIVLCICSTILFSLKVLKYVLIAFVIIAWSPCILAVAVCWLLVYPLKPHYVLEDVKKSEHLNHKKWLSTRILEWTVKTSRCLLSKIFDLNPSFIQKELSKHKKFDMHKKLCIHKELGKPIKLTQRCSPSQITEIRPKDSKTSSKWEPNPSKRYILFYDSERGWLLKPLRSEPCEECKRPEVVQNLRFNRMSPPHNKSVTFSNAKQEKDEYSHKCECLPDYCPYPPLPPTIDKMTCVSSSSCFPDKMVLVPMDHQASHRMAQQELTPIDTSYAPSDQKAARGKYKRRLYLDDATIASVDQKPARKIPGRKKSKQLLIPADTTYVPMDQKEARKLGVNTDDLRFAPMDQQAAQKLNKQSHIPDDRRFVPMDQKHPRRKTTRVFNPNDIKFAPVNQKYARRRTIQETISNDMDKKSKRGRQLVITCKTCPKRKLLLEKRAKAKEQSKAKKRCPHPPICRTIVKPCHRRHHTRLKSQTNYIKSRPACKSNATFKYVKGVKPSAGKSVGEYFKSCGRDFMQLICEAEKQWDGMDCNSIYIQTLRKRPCFWIYYCCKSIYPTFLACHRACCNLCYMLLLMLSILVWCPCLCIFYLCCTLFCGCNQ